MLCQFDASPAASSEFQCIQTISADRPDVAVPSVASTTSPRNAPGGILRQNPQHITMIFGILMNFVGDF